MRTHVLGLALLVACSSPAKKEPPPPPPPVALAIVFNGQEIWVGNETHETDPSVQYKGALRDLVVAFDRLKAPADANGLVVSYADGVHLHHPLGPLREITGSTFGVQRDYRSRIGSDLVEGIAVAAEMLPHGMHGVIVVIGDGNDSHNETATMRLLVLRRALAKRGVALHALVIPSALSPDGDVIGVLTPNLRRIKSTAIATELQAIVQTELTSPRGASH